MNTMLYVYMYWLQMITGVIAIECWHKSCQSTQLIGQVVNHSKWASISIAIGISSPFKPLPLNLSVIHGSNVWLPLSNMAAALTGASEHDGQSSVITWSRNSRGFPR